MSKTARGQVELAYLEHIANDHLLTNLSKMRISRLNERKNYSFWIMPEKILHAFGHATTENNKRWLKKISWFFFSFFISSICSQSPPNQIIACNKCSDRSWYSSRTNDRVFEVTVTVLKYLKVSKRTWPFTMYCNIILK